MNNTINFIRGDADSDSLKSNVNDLASNLVKKDKKEKGRRVVNGLLLVYNGRLFLSTNGNVSFHTWHTLRNVSISSSGRTWIVEEPRICISERGMPVSA